MGENSRIEWTHHTFNPWRGCTKVSPGCAHCYAEKLSHRNPSVLGIWGDHGTRVVASESAWREPLKWDRAAAKAGERHRVFCASLADVFEDREELVNPRIRLFHLINETPHLDWLLLTKRPQNWRKMWPLVPIPGHVRQNEGDGKDWQKFSNLWLGTSVEDQARADERIPHLLRCPAAVRFLSVEPLLGPIDLTRLKLPLGGESFERANVLHRKDSLNKGKPRAAIDWVIVGGESGPGARPMHPDWARAIRNQCRAEGVPFFFKQWGGVHKKLNGRLLDGREWSEFPESPPCSASSAS